MGLVSLTHGEQPHGFVARADEGMYQAKRGEHLSATPSVTFGRLSLAPAERTASSARRLEPRPSMLHAKSKSVDRRRGRIGNRCLRVPTEHDALGERAITVHPACA